MIDFIKIVTYPSNTEKLEKSKLLQFKTITYKGKTDYGWMKKAHYNGISFKITPIKEHPYQQLIVTGSLHDYYNNFKNNVIDFGVDQISEVVKDILDNFNIDIGKGVLLKFSMGINIFYEKDIDLVNHCLLYNNKRFNKVYTQDNGCHLQISSKKFHLNIYDNISTDFSKSYYPEKIMGRFEIVFEKINYFSVKSGFLLEDHLKKRLFSFSNLFDEIWDNVSFFDSHVLKGSSIEKTINNKRLWNLLNQQQLNEYAKQLKKNTDSIPFGNKNTISYLIKRKVEKLCSFNLK